MNLPTKSPFVESISIWVLLYLAMPAFIHLLGFVRWELNLPTILLLCWAFWIIFKPMNGIQSWRLLFAFILSFTLLLLIGFPNGPYGWDWIKHWALLNALATREWPVIVTLQGIPQYLRFYDGAYLVPSLLNKLLNIPIVWSTMVWFGIGFLLLLCIIQAIQPKWPAKRIVLMLAALMLLGGADAWAEMFLRWLVGLTNTGIIGIHHEWWWMICASPPLQFSSPITLLLWVPHQGVPTLMVSTLLLLSEDFQTLLRSILGISLLSLWSPFGMIGLLPLAALKTIAIIKNHDQWNWLNFIVVTLASCLFAMLIALSLSKELPQDGLSFQNFVNNIFTPQKYIAFYAVELIAPIIILREKLWTDLVCRISVIILLILPMTAGIQPDPVMRISMGPLFVLMLRSAERVATCRTRKDLLIVVVSLLLVSPTIIGEISYHIQHGKAHKMLNSNDYLHAYWYYTLAPNHKINIQQFFELCGWQWRSQYFMHACPPTFCKRSLRENVL